MNNIFLRISAYVSALLLCVPSTIQVYENDSFHVEPIADISIEEVVEDVIKEEPVETPVTRYQSVIEELRLKASSVIAEIKSMDMPAGVKTESETTRYYDVPLSEDLQDYIFEVCESYNVDPELVIAMIRKESTYNASTIGDNGESFGLMQIQPRWHQERMDKLDCTNLLDPYQNIKVGVDYLAQLFAEGKSLEWTLMAYNGGPTYANRKAAEGFVSEYVLTVKQYVAELRFA